MISTQLLSDFFAGGLILSTFLMLGKVRLLQMLRYFAIASFFLAAFGFTTALLSGESDPWIGPVATVIFKVIFIPAFISYTAKKIPASNQIKGYLKPAMTYFLFAVILLLSGIIVRNLPLDFNEIAGLHSSVNLSNVFFFRSLVFISITLILTGIFLMIIRKDLFSQVLGLMTLENGISAFALVALNKIPLFLEMGIFLVIMVSTVIFGILNVKVHEIYDVGDTEKLNELVD